MAVIYTVKKKHLTKFHRNGLVILSTFCPFNPKRVVSPYICQWNPHINLTLLNPKIPISMKNAAS